MITRELIPILQCPTCRQSGLDFRGAAQAEESFEEGELNCTGCGADYPVRLGVPVLLPHGELNTEEWRLWQVHLEKFQARRLDRIAHPNRLVTQLMEGSRPKQPFAQFTGISGGRVLDVGCGPGKFRFNWTHDGLQYVGLDPIHLPDVRDFPFVRGLAEYLPFTKGSFSHIVVLAALDHFRDPASFFREARRVLEPGGRLHILQSVHEVKGPVSAIRVLGHKIKDSAEDWYTRDYGADVPKHLSEFTQRSLVEAARPHFDVMKVEQYSAHWYSPTKLFVTFEPGTALSLVGQSA